MTLPDRYTRTAMVLHWVIAVLMIVNVAFALLDDRFGDDHTRFMVDTHKSIGITILGLALLRLLWRLTHRPPPLPDHYRSWEKRASHAAHLALYVLIFALPLSGWMHDSAWSAAPRIKMYWFGLFEWPRIGWIMDMAPAAKKAAHAELFAVHAWLGYALYVLLFLHVGGALKHQFIDKQPELQRMS
mgnify:FL=1